MNLRRYNEILLAVLMTGTAIGLIVYGIQQIRHRSQAGSGPSDSSSNGAAGVAKHSLALCLPSFAAGTDYQYFPVAAVRSTAQRPAAAGQPWTANLMEACHLAEGTSDGIFDVVIRNSSTSEQRLLLGHPGQVLDMTLPDPGCAGGAGAVPCGTIFWLVRDEDSNRDGVVDARDNTILYVSDLSARQLLRVSPEDASVLDWTWNARSGEILLQVQLAAGGTEVVNARLQPPAPGSAVVQPRVRDQLQRALEPELQTPVPAPPVTATP
jgi:hypothetical protein